MALLTPWRPPYVRDNRYFQISPNTSTETRSQSAYSGGGSPKLRENDSPYDPLITVLDAEDESADNNSQKTSLEKGIRVPKQSELMTIAVSIIGGALNLAVRSQSDSEWNDLFPGVEVEDFCQNLSSFLSRHLPTAIDYSADVSIDSDRRDSILHRRSVTKGVDMVNQKKKVTVQARRANPPRTTTGGAQNIDDLQAAVQTHLDELVHMEQQLLQYVDNPTETVKLQLKIKHLERVIFDAKSALNVAAATGEFRREVRELQGEVGEVKAKQVDLEQRVEARDAEVKCELEKFKERFEQVEKENEERKAENAALKQMITKQATAQNHFQKTLDAVDNRQRVQNLRLHGIQTDRVDEELKRVLPRDIYEQIDIAYATGPNQGNHKPVLIRLKSRRGLRESSHFCSLTGV
jgi:hypothetical protein